MCSSLERLHDLLSRSKKLPPFTLLAALTRLVALAAPLRKTRTGWSRSPIVNRSGRPEAGSGNSSSGGSSSSVSTSSALQQRELVVAMLQLLVGCLLEAAPWVTVGEVSGVVSFILDSSGLYESLTDVSAQRQTCSTPCLDPGPASLIYCVHPPLPSVPAVPCPCTEAAIQSQALHA